MMRRRINAVLKMMAGLSAAALAFGQCTAGELAIEKTGTPVYDVWNLAHKDAAMRSAAVQWESSRVLLVGEMHGTAEVPRFVGELLTREAKRRPVVLALERSDAEKVALDAFLSSRGSEDDRRALARDKRWSQGMPDGRSSVAELDLIDVVRRLHQAGMHVDVLLTEKVPADMSVLSGPGAAQRYVEKSMADSIRDALVHGMPDTLVVGLMGSYHLRVSNEGPYGPSVAGQLNDLSPAVAFVDGVGSAWTCVDDACGPHNVSVGSQVTLAGDAHAREVNRRLAIVSLYFPRLTASSPASLALLVQ